MRILLSATLFGGLNGSIVAGTARVGPNLISAMIKEGYSSSLSAKNCRERTKPIVQKRHLRFCVYSREINTRLTTFERS